MSYLFTQVNKRLYKKRYFAYLSSFSIRFALPLLLLLLLTGVTYSMEIDKLLNNLGRTEGDSQKIAAYKQVIKYYINKNDDSAIHYAENGLLYALNKNYPLGQADMVAALSIIDEQQGRQEIAKRRVAYAINIYREQNYLKGIAALYNCIGEVEVIKNDFPTAKIYFLNAYKLHDSITDKEGKMITCTNLGNVYLGIRDTVNASKYLSIADSISKGMAVNETTIRLNTSMGNLYFIKGDTARAFSYFQKSIEISEHLDFATAHAESLQRLGSFCYKNGKYTRALQYLENGLAIAKENNLLELQGYILLDLAAINSKTAPAKSVTYLRGVVGISRKTEPGVSALLLAKAAAMYDTLGLYKEALLTTRQQLSIVDNLAGINKEKEYASLGAVYELERSRTKVKSLELHIKKNTQMRAIIIGVSFVIIVTLIIVVIYYLKTKRLNKDLIAHETNLKELNSTKDKLFSIIGHDLRAPIARVPMILEMCEDEGVSTEEKKYLRENMKEHIFATIDTLDKLLFWGKLLMKGETITPEKIKPKPFIEGNIKLKKNAALDKKITVSDVTQDIEVYSDKGHFDFIIRNLFANAIKFTRAGGVIIIDAISDMMPGYIVFAVKDNGVGMDKEKLKHLFEPFHSMAGSAHEKGTGMGLMLCKEFAIKNGGDIWAESEPGKGAVFYYSVKKEN